ncbi:MAG: hypothetical protein ACOY16_06660 [Chloroflexota bacterium]
MSEKKILIGIALALVVLCLGIVCLCSIAGGSLMWYWTKSSTEVSEGAWNSFATPTPHVIRPTASPTDSNRLDPTGEAGNSSPGYQLTPIPAISDAQNILSILDNTIVPESNLIELAERLQGKKNISPTQPPPTRPYQVGDQRTFWVSNVDTNENFQVNTTLQYVTDHAYFWIENGVPFKQKDLQDLAETFENQIYPTNREFFGSEWSPGVDGDPRLYILYVRNAGSGIAGYFSSVDEYPPEAHEYSNWHETFVFNADNVDLRDEFTYGVLAHEFQHMIHWAGDRNEDIWMNEGFSDLAMFLNGYSIGGHDYLFAQDPDIQLNDWPTDQSETTPHYGASFLFTAYFLDRFGEQATKELIRQPENGFASMDTLFTKLGLQDSLRGRAITADDVFQDWTLANYLHNRKVEDGRFFYSNYTSAPEVSDTETISDCSSNFQTRDVRQYGADYIRLRCRGDVTLRFEGSVQVGLLPADPYSGSWAFWSNKGDESDMTLTRTFDFTSVQAPLTLSYWTWYDLEKDYDYAYVLASADGESWEMLRPPSGTSQDITGNNFGFGYNGMSGGGEEALWIQESVDLSSFAGQKVYIRFEYVTDAAVNGEGLLLDDVAIPEIGYFTDFETDDGGWEAAGFVRVQNALPQTYRLALIRLGSTPMVEYLTLFADNTLELPLSFGSGMREAVLVVSGTTRYTRQPAAYRFKFIP